MRTKAHGTKCRLTPAQGAGHLPIRRCRRSQIWPALPTAVLAATVRHRRPAVAPPIFRSAQAPDTAIPAQTLPRTLHSGPEVHLLLRFQLLLRLQLPKALVLPVLLLGPLRRNGS